MIQWLIQSQADVPQAPPYWLSAAEQLRYAALKSEKRRADWLLGRWTMKQLLQQQLGGDLRDYEIGNDADGVPILHAPGQPPHVLSISHAQQHALCAISAQSGLGLGCDLEHIEPRAATFAHDYFTASEIAQVEAGPIGLRETIVTAIWSAKEAALKATHLGLSVDTRRVDCVIDPAQLSDHRWVELSIHFDQRPVRGWWRVWRDFVLTLAVTSEE